MNLSEIFGCDARILGSEYNLKKNFVFLHFYHSVLTKVCNPVDKLTVRTSVGQRVMIKG